MIDPGRMPFAMLTTRLAGAPCAAQPAQTEMRLPQNFSARKNLQAFRREAS
jgi:hypothetical protein